MKKSFILAVLALLCYTAATAQSKKIVVDAKGNIVGTLAKANADTYTVYDANDQDGPRHFNVPKTGHRVVIFSAEAGQGTVHRNEARKGNINVRKGPSTNSAVIAKISDNWAIGDLPEYFDCLGKEKGWYKIRIEGKVGYVRQDMVIWEEY